MPVIDAEGRLFGRVNLIDAAIGAFVVLLVPLAVGAVLLFRPPRPTITQVEPAQLSNIEDRAAQGSSLAGKLKLRGSGFRPVMRVEIGSTPALAFIFENPSAADVLFGDLPAGAHDLVLYDGRQELARARGAVVIPERRVRAGMRMRVLGRYLDLSESAAHSLKPGMKLPDEGDPSEEILALGEPEPARFPVNGNSEAVVSDRWQRRVLAAAYCEVALLVEGRDCRMKSGSLVAPGQMLTLTVAGGSYSLLSELVLPDRDPEIADMRVRFVGYPGVVDLVRVGDQDRPHWALDGRGAAVTALGARREITGSVSVGLSQEGLGVSADLQAVDHVSALDATLRLGLDRLQTGWRYRGDSVRVGGPITFTTPTYVVRGIVLGLDARAPSGANGTNR